MADSLVEWHSGVSNDPGMGVIRHVDAGYDEAIECANERGVKIPMWM